MKERVLNLGNQYTVFSQSPNSVCTVTFYDFVGFCVEEMPYQVDVNTGNQLYYRMRRDGWTLTERSELDSLLQFCLN